MAEGNDSSNVEVLIIGAGPSGLMAALWMAQLGIKTRVIDKHATEVPNGHADGLQIRTVEIFDSFGFAHRLMQHAGMKTEFRSWTLNESGDLHRSARTALAEGSDSTHHAHMLHQGDIERLLLDAIADRSDVKVERATLPISLEFNESQAEDEDAYPITIELKHLKDDEIERPHFNAHSVSKDGIKKSTDGRFKSILGRSRVQNIHSTRGESGITETVHAKYMIGCDGAHSWVRRQVGLELEGENVDMAWGVMDIIPITNFPDAHVSTTVQSKAGSLIFVPRENNLVRLYIQLGAVARDARTPDTIAPEEILAQAQAILSPFTLRYTYCDWWTVYRVGQRVANHYAAARDRIFLAGDAVHTHTPKGGQGMNVSMQDAYNLGWKLGGVLHGVLPRSVLATYEAERRPVARRLIAWDKELSRIYSGSTGEAVHQAYVQNMQFQSGVGVTYGPGVLVGHGLDLQENGAGTAVVAKQHLAPVAVLGKRFPAHRVQRMGDCRHLHLSQLLESDGRWRLVVFGGDAVERGQMERLNALGSKLVADRGILTRYKAFRDGTYPIQLLLIHAADGKHVELADFHSTFFPFDEDEGYDYDRLYADEKGAAHAFFGIDVGKGCLVVLRPDQHVGYIGELEDLEDLTGYFDPILVQRTGLAR